MGRRYLHLAGLMALLLVAARADTRYFRGQLSEQLSVEPDSWSGWTWHTASAGELRRLGIRPNEVEQAFAGECRLPDDPRRPVHGRVVFLKDGRKLAYLDLNRDDSFGPDESAPFEAPPEGSAVAAVARLMLPLADEPYRAMPVLVALPSAQTAVPPSEPGTQRVLIGTDTYIAGQADMPFGPVAMRFSYSLHVGSIPAGAGPGAGAAESDPADMEDAPAGSSGTREWMDTNRDGRIDTTPGSPEVGVAHGAAPIFHVKNLYVQVTRLDPETRTFTLKTVSAKEYRRIPMAVGDRLPDFSFRTLDGKKRSLSRIKGKYRLLNFWTTWCRSCVEELPILKATYERYHAQGFEILGLNGDDDAARAQALLGRFDVPWPQAALDREQTEQRFQISAWPTKVLIDRHGRVIALLRSDRELDQTLRRLLE